VGGGPERGTGVLSELSIDFGAKIFSSTGHFFNGQKFDVLLLKINSYICFSVMIAVVISYRCKKNNKVQIRS
jgi:hypothetical protein